MRIEARKVRPGDVTLMGRILAITPRDAMLVFDYADEYSEAWRGDELVSVQ